MLFAGWARAASGILLVLVACISADLDAVYVQSGAPGDGTSPSSPCGTIAQGFALAEAENAATIFLAPGRYAGEDNYGFTTFRKSAITFAKNGDGEVVVDLTGNNGTAFLSSYINQAVMNIQDITFEKSDKGIVIEMHHAHPSNISNCIFQHNGWLYDANSSDIVHAVNIERSNVDIVGCTFHNNTGNFGSALFLEQSEGIVLDSTFTNNTAFFDGETDSFYNRGGAIGVESAQSSNLAISGCFFSGNSAEFGGALNVFSSTSEKNSYYVTLTSNIFSENSATTSGGAIYSSADLKMQGSTFTSNTAPRDGGAMYLRRGSGSNGRSNVISQSTFQENTAEYGGAVYVDTLVPTFIESTFLTKNSASNDGGALFLGYEGTLTVSASDFFLNTARDGGAIFTRSRSDTNLAVKDGCSFSGNFAQNNGGAVLVDGPLYHFQISNSDFINNVANTSRGGALRFLGSGIVNGCTFVNNTARDGGGVSVYDSGLFVISGCTFENNDASYRGGGLYISDECGGLVSQSKFVNNHAGDRGGGTYQNFAKLPIEYVGCEWVDNTSPDGNHIYLYATDYTEQNIFFRSCNLVPVDGGSTYDFRSDNSTVVFDRTCSLNKMALHHDTHYAMCGCGGSMFIESLEMYSEAVFVDETLTIGHLNWTNGYFGYVPKDDCVKGSLHFHLNHTETTGAQIVVKDGVIQEEYNSHHTHNRVSSYGLDWVVTGNLEINGVNISLEGGDFINNGSTHLSTLGGISAEYHHHHHNDDPFADEQVQHVWNHGNLTMEGGTLVAGNLTQTETGVLTLVNVLGGDPAKCSHRFDLGGEIDVPNDEEVFNVKENYLLMTWRQHTGGLKRFLMDTHASNTTAVPLYASAGLYAEVGSKPKSSGGLGGGAVFGIIVAVFVVIALVGLGAYYGLKKSKDMDGYGDL